MFAPPSPLVVAGLLLVAALLASLLKRPPWLNATAAWIGAASPLAWYVTGVLLGPVLHVLDEPVLAACRPVLAVAIGWVAVRAGARAAAPFAPDAHWTPRRAAGLGAALVIPAALLYAAGRWLPAELAPAWSPLAPVIATLAAALTAASPGDPRRVFPWVGLVAAGALLWLLPHARHADLLRLAGWGAFLGGGAVLCGAIAVRLRAGESGPGLTGGTAAAIVLASGLGFATKTSPLLVCGLLGAGLARWSTAHRRLARELATSEPTAAAVLWVGAGAMWDGGGPLAAVALSAVVLATAPLLLSRLSRSRIVSGSRRALALAVVWSFTMTGTAWLEPATIAAARTAAALALLLVSALQTLPGLAADRLTAPTRSPEVSV